MRLDTKTYWLTDSQSQCDFDFDFTRQSWDSSQKEVGVRWPPACEDVSPGAEDRRLLADVSKQRSEDSDCLCDSGL
jgi:hypothetical protein